MPKIDFYVLATADPSARDQLACRLTEKAYNLGHQVHIHTDSESTAQHLDMLLWTFRDRSFIAHAIAPATLDDCPVTLGHGWAPPHGDVLINLAAEVPDFFKRFERVAEIVNSDARDAGRARYRHYRDQGCQLSHHDIKMS